MVAAVGNQHIQGVGTPLPSLPLDVEVTAACATPATPAIGLETPAPLPSNLLKAWQLQGVLASTATVRRGRTDAPPAAARHGLQLLSHPPQL